MHYMHDFNGSWNCLSQLFFTIETTFFAMRDMYALETFCVPMVQLFKSLGGIYTIKGRDACSIFWSKRSDLTIVKSHMPTPLAGMTGALLAHQHVTWDPFLQNCLIPFMILVGDGCRSVDWRCSVSIQTFWMQGLQVSMGTFGTDES